MYKKYLSYLFLIFFSLFIISCQTNPVQIEEPNPLGIAFSILPTEIEVGESVTINWDVSNATQVIISPGIGEVDLIGTVTVFPTETTEYSIIASNASDTQTASVTVIVNEINPAEEGTLVVQANVVASIYLDGVETGYSTPHTFTGLAPGTYMVKLTSPYRKNWEYGVTIIAGETKTIAANLKDAIRTAVLQPGISEGKDAWIYNIDGNYNGGEDNYLQIGAFDAGPYGYGLCKSYFYFDLSSIPETANIMDSQLYLYYFNNNEGTCGFNCQFYIFEVLGSWKENKICWNNKPEDASFGMGNTTLPLEPTNAFVELSVNSNLVERWVQGDHENYGFIVSFEANMEEYCQLTRKFYSSEYSTQTKRPKLVIQYWSAE